jgi:hypothetical protein
MMKLNRDEQHDAGKRREEKLLRLGNGESSDLTGSLREWHVKCMMPCGL